MRSFLHKFKFLITVLICGSLLYTNASAITVGSLGQNSTAKLYAGGWQTVYDSGELETAVTALTISGLNGDTDEEYHLICRFVDKDTTGSYYLRLNNDSGNNYGYQYIDGTSDAATAARDTSEAQMTIGYTNTDSNICFSETLIHAKSGYIRTALTKYVGDISGTTITNIRQLGQVWNNTADNVTSLVIGALNDKMGVGTRIILFARRLLGTDATTGIRAGTLNVKGKVNVGTWQLVERYEVTGSAVTSKTFSGLDGNTDVIYKIKACIVSGATNSNYYVRPNNDTGSNCGNQVLTGNNTTVAAARDTSETYMWLTNTGDNDSGNIAMFEILLFAKSGYVRTSIGETTEKISTTTVTQTGLFANAWNNTADNITSLVVLSDQTDGLGIGTVLELWAYRMYSNQ